MVALSAQDYYRMLVDAGHENEARDFARQFSGARSVGANPYQAHFRALIEGGREEEARAFAKDFHRQRSFGIPAQQAASQAFEATAPAGLTGVLSSAAEGATLGFSDELLEAGARLLGRPEEEVDRTLASVRRKRRRFQERYPVGAFAAEAIPSLVVGGAAGRGLASATGQAVTGLRGTTALGAAGGALSGVGHAEPGERLTGGLRGFGLGGITGAAGGALASRLPGRLPPLSQLNELRGVAGAATQAFRPGRAAKELAEAERAIRPRVIPGFVRTEGAKGTKFLRDMGKQPPILRKFFSEEPRLVQLQLEAMDPLKRAAHQRKFLSSLDKAFSRAPRLAATDAAAITGRLPSIFYDNPRLAQTIQSRIQQWVATGERPGLQAQQILKQIEERVEGFRQQALPFAIPGAFLDPLTTAGSVAGAYGLPAAARRAGEAARTRLGPFPAGSVRPGGPAQEAARKALAAEKRSLRKPKKKQPPAEETIPAPEPIAARPIPTPPPPPPGGAPLGYSPFGAGLGGAVPPGRGPVGGLPSPAPPSRPPPPVPPPELQIPYSAGRLPPGFRQTGPERAPPPPPPPMGGHIDISTQGGQLPAMLPNPAMPDLRSMLPGATPRGGAPGMAGGMPPTARPPFNPTFPGTFNPFAGDAPFFPPRAAPTPPTPRVDPQDLIRGARAARGERLLQSIGPDVDVERLVRGMNMLERRSFQTEAMKDVLRLEREGLKGARMATLEDDIRAVFVNNRTLMLKARKAVGRWVNQGGSLSDHLRDVGAPKWLSGGLE